jgi:digeranylgeranylglycerophospholipid reductase
MATTCDVLVVGAGPAGSSAARAAAEGGAHTIISDKRAEIGVPVQCAEAIGEYLIPYLPFHLPAEQLIWKIDGMLFWAEDTYIEQKGGFWSGYAINRVHLDKWLASSAVKAGAELYLESELEELEFDETYLIKKAILKTKYGLKEIEPKAVIAADGVHSKVLNCLGFTDLEERCGEVLSFELHHVELHKPNFEQLYFGDFAPGGYAYIFPLSRKRANVGVGSLFQTERLENCYEEFLELPAVKKQLKHSEKVNEKSGWAPIRYFTDNWNYGNILLAGDAANQNFKPFVEGILPAIICGYLAGNTASNFVQKKGMLDVYQKEIMDTIGIFFLESNKILEALQLLNSRSNKKDTLLRFGLFSSAFSPEEIFKLRNEEYGVLKRRLEKWRI